MQVAGQCFFNLNEWISDNMNKEPEERRDTSSQVKRRRMLDFKPQAVDSSLYGEEMSSAFLKSNVSSG